MNHLQFCEIVNSNFTSYVPEITNLISEYYFFMTQITFEEYFQRFDRIFIELSSEERILLPTDSILYGYYDINDIFVIHNEGDQPAVISENIKMWVSHGKILVFEGIHYKSCYVNNKLHKRYYFENGGSVLYYDENSQLHRDPDENGNYQPSIIYSNGEKEYYNHGIRIENKFVNYLKYILFACFLYLWINLIL